MRVPLIICFALAASARPIRAQEPVRVLDLGTPVSDTGRGAVPDSLLARTILRFNDSATTRLEGILDLAPKSSMSGTLALYGNIARIKGTVHGSVIVLNGDLRIASTGRVEGDIIVLGGKLTVAAGGVVTGDTTSYGPSVPVKRAPDGTVSRQAPSKVLTDYTSASASFAMGPVATTVRAGAGTYNRTEGLPIQAGPSFSWNANEQYLLKLDLVGILRTSSSPNGDRPDVGWTGRFAIRRGGKQPITFGVDGASQVAPMVDRAYSNLESGLAAFLIRRDYRDWYQTSGWGVFANWSPIKPLTAALGYHASRERSVQATDVFSLFRGSESWRPNPLVDDGEFQAVTFGVNFDSRDRADHPTSGWWVQSEFKHVTSDNLTPASISTDIRDPMPTTGYAADEINIDARYYLRLNPKHSIHLRGMAGGWIGGDPLVVQHRRALDGLDPMGGYTFRFLTCDRSRRPDPAETALCDRQMLLQGEFRRTLDLNLSTRVGGSNIGLQRADLVFFGDLGTAWLAGDGAGQVPSNKIQSLSEWRSDIGIGIDAGSFGLYLGKAIADAEPIRLGVRLVKRF